MEKSVSTIQTLFRFKKFNILSNEFKNLELKKIDNVTKLAGNLCNKVLISLVHEMLMCMNKQASNQEARLFLSCFFIMSDEDTRGEEINTYAIFLINFIEFMSYMPFSYWKKCYPIFNYSIKNFKKELDLWKSKDVEQFLQPLFQSLHELKFTYSLIDENEDKHEWRNKLEEQMEDIENKILKLDPKGMEKFKDFVPEVANQMDEQDIYTVAAKAYWDSYKAELELKPPKHVRTIKMLKEIRVRLCCLLKVGSKTVQEIEENIDEELVDQMIKNDAMDKESFGKLVFYIIDIIRRLGPEAYDEDIDQWTSVVKESIGRLPISSFLPHFFNSVFERIEDIEKIVYELGQYQQQQEKNKSE